MAKKARRKSGSGKAGPLAVLASPVRREIWSYLKGQGPSMVVEIAKGMGRSQTSLYSHITSMEKSGAIEQAGSKRSGKRPAVIYKACLNDSKVSYNPNDNQSVRASVRYAAAVFRRANREVTDHLASGTAKTKGRSRDTFVLGSRARLTRKQLADINGHIDAIDKIVALGDKSGRADLYSVNIATCPLKDNFQ